MKKLITIAAIILLCLGNTYAQSILYKQTFDSSYADWHLNTTDLGGDSSLTDNQWIVNNVYAGGNCFATPIDSTRSEPAGISGAPQSHYMHIMSGFCATASLIYNCNYDANVAGPTFFAKQTSYINTTNDSDVSFSFWWLCLADASSFGNVYYSIDSPTNWVRITTPIDSFYGSANWSKDSVHLAAFDRQAHLQFGFEFSTLSTTGNDPAFGIDDIIVKGIRVTTAVPFANDENMYFDVAANGNNAILSAAKRVNNALTVVVYSATGRMISQHNWEAGNNSLYVNMSDCATGLYIFKIYGENTASVLKWQKL